MGLMALALAAIAALVVVFPGTDFRTRVLAQGRLDDVGTAFLRSLIRRQPDDTALRIAMIESEAGKGNTEGALRELETLRSRDAPTRDLALLEYRILARRTDGVAIDIADLRARLKRLGALDWDARELEYLAVEAERVGEPAMAARWYGRLAAAPTSRGAHWAGEAVRAGLGGGEYGVAADACLLAMERSGNPSDRRSWFLRAIGVMRAGGLHAKALAMADRHLGEFRDDDDVLAALVALARETGDHERAQRYARQLMRMSVGAPPWRFAERLMDVVVPAAHAAENAGPTRTVEREPRMRPFDDAKYALAYDVFVGAGNLADAVRVAMAAVKQVPADLAWRGRLAQAAEWAGQPVVAVEQWHYIATKAPAMKERETAWQGVLRLAPGLQNDELTLAALLHVADTQTMDDERWRTLAQTFERAGRITDAPAYFAKRYAATPTATLLEIHGRLLEGLGRDADAIDVYRELVTKFGASGPRLTRLAVLLIRHNRLRESFDALQAHRKAVAPEDADFWTLFADLAWQLQQDAAALEGYRALSGTKAADGNIVRRLVDLTRVSDPGGAARIAAMGFEKFHVPGLLISAAELYWQERDLTALAALYGRMSAEDEKHMASYPFFHVLRAQFEAASGRREQAGIHYRRALAQEPGNPELVSALLWHLIDGRETDTLRRELRARETKARDDAALWEVYAAGYTVLSEAGRALDYYRRLGPAKSGDYLWLINYADVLDQGGFGSMALRVRRHAWLVLRDQPASAAPDRPRMEAIARLALAGASPDAQLNLVRRMLRQDTAEGVTSEQDRRLDAGTRELVLSWALASGQSDSARQWLLLRYAGQLEQPAWARLSIALADRDLPALESLLAGDASALPVADHIEAARLVGKIELARKLAFETQEKKPDSDDMHLRLSETLIDTANAFAYEPMSFERGVLRGREQRSAVSVWLNAKLRLTADYMLNDQLRTSAAGAASITGIPSRTEEQGVALRWQEGTTYTELRVARRLAMTDTASVALAHGRELTPRLSSVFRLGLRERAPETIPLLLAGTRDRASVVFGYRIAAREYFNAEAWSARYHTQDGASLGRGEGLTWEAGHRMRIDYPDLRVRMNGSHQHYVADGALDARAASLVPAGAAATAGFMIPRDFDLYGFYLTAGDTYRDRYSRALRPYADVGRTWNSVSGNGFLFAVGGTASVAGHDRLSFGFTRSKGGSAIGGYTTEVGVRYEYLFDR